MRIYIFCAFIAAIFAAFFIGRESGRSAMRIIAAESAQIAQYEIIQKIQGVVNESFNLGVDDIRNWLREKYTITE